MSKKSLEEYLMISQKNIKNKNSIDCLKANLLLKGTCHITNDNLFLSREQWKTLKHEISLLEYKKISIGDTKEPLSFWVSRVKLPKDENIKNKIIFDIIDSTQCRQLFSLITGINHFFIDRCQCHFYEEGDFISIHRDKDSCEEYEYVLSFYFDGDYKGGEFVVHLPNGEKDVYVPRSGEILISTCEYLHEVKTVKSGKRNVLHAFIQPMKIDFEDSHKGFV